MRNLLDELRARYRLELATLDRVLVRIGAQPVAEEIIKMRAETEQKLRRLTPARVR